MSRKKYIAGNWKMNGAPAQGRALATDVRKGLEGYTKADVALCPPFVSLALVSEVLSGSPIRCGGQNLHWEKSGAFTGEISAEMLVGAGCKLALVGHSERRQLFGDTDEQINKRVKAALAAGLDVILCVGETLDERKQNVTNAVIKRMLDGGLVDLTAADLARITLAYEPVWAIGTGMTATPLQAQEVHSFVRGLLQLKFSNDLAESMRIQYGGSVKPANAKELLGQPDIDGLLVGGASLVAADFVQIVKAAG